MELKMPLHLYKNYYHFLFLKTENKSGSQMIPNLTISFQILLIYLSMIWLFMGIASPLVQKEFCCCSYTKFLIASCNNDFELLLGYVSLMCRIEMANFICFCYPIYTRWVYLCLINSLDLYVPMI